VSSWLRLAPVAPESESSAALIGVNQILAIATPFVQSFRGTAGSAMVGTVQVSDITTVIGGGAGGPRLERRLVAVAFIDIVGYSVLMAEDEAGTHGRWMRILAEIVRPASHRYRGKVVKSTGDGVLAEFASALDAVEWACEVQRILRNERLSEDQEAREITFRISVHLGDVFTVDDDIYGDGVNVAARLLEHSEPGGVVLSEAVHDLVRGNSAAPARDLGLLQLKNFPDPVHAYALDPEGAGAAATVRSRPTLLPSIAVLPLVNLSGNPDDDYFSDGVVEDIIVSLAGLRELVVIARTSALTVGRRQTDPREIGRALAVRYVLTGSIRRSPLLLRVSVRLHDVQSGAGIWGETMEAAPSELFELQDRIVQRIVAGIAPHVRSRELLNALRKRPESVTAYDHTLRGLDLIHSLEKSAFMQARTYLDQAMAEDPSFAMPVAWAARWHSLLIGQGWSADRRDDSKKGAELAIKAIELDRQNAMALATYGHLRSFLFHDYDTALVYFDRALAACPNSALAWILSSATLSYIGQGEQAVRHAGHGIRLSPFDQSLFHFYMFLALAHYAHGAYDDAVKWCRMSQSENPRYTSNVRLLTAALAALDRQDEARATAARLIDLQPDFTLSRYEFEQPFRDAAIKAKFIDDLRRAGLPP
jgi:adenylate cyclase